MSVYVFDLFGTLVNYESLTEKARAYTADPGRLIELWRFKQIALAQAATIMGRFVDFDALTRAALVHSSALCGLAMTGPDVDELSAAWDELPLFEDVPEALERLSGRADALAILTNGTHAMLEKVTRRAGIAQRFDALLSVQDAAKYKPAFDVYQLAVDRFDVPKERIRFVSSNGWDAAGAGEFGFEVVWCNRSGAPREPLWKAPAHIIASLAELP